MPVVQPIPTFKVLSLSADMSYQNIVKINFFEFLILNIHQFNGLAKYRVQVNA